MPYWKSLSHSSWFCKVDRQTRLMNKVSKRFEKKLDIRSLVKVRTNLALLIRMLLSDEQMLLFRLQRRQAVSIAIQGNKWSSSMDKSSYYLSYKSQKEEAKTFVKLIGFYAKSNLDQKLIYGTFGAMTDKRVNDGEVFGRLRQHPPGFGYVQNFDPVSGHQNNRPRLILQTQDDSFSDFHKTFHLGSTNHVLNLSQILLMFQYGRQNKTKSQSKRAWSNFILNYYQCFYLN